MPESLADPVQHFAIVSRAIDYIRSHARRQPSLAEIAAAIGISEYHLQRIFSQWAGVSPKRFLQFLTKEHARQALLDSQDVLSATLDSGLSSPGRLHDLMVSCEAMTPGEIRQRGHGVEVGFGMGATPFGNALVAWTTRGICQLAFCDDDSGDHQRTLAQQWPGATLRRNDDRAQALCGQIFARQLQPGRLHLVLRGTNFQIKVWEALLQISSAQLISYSGLARLSGNPRAQRAIGSALAANPMAYLIPCHRVIRESGVMGQYRWGESRKLAMHAWETSRTAGDAQGTGNVTL